MYSLRVSPQGKALIEECAAICGISTTKVLRTVASWAKSGRVRIASGIDTVEITRRNGIVIKINVSENYYKNVSEIITAEMPTPETANQRDFRIMLIAVCIDVVTDHRDEFKRIQALEERAGVDYNVPERILELREMAKAGQRSSI